LVKKKSIKIKPVKEKGYQSNEKAEQKNKTLPLLTAATSKIYASFQKRN